MSGMYGTVKPADIIIEKDVEIFYNYRPSLNSEHTDFDTFEKLDVKYLTNCKLGNTENPEIISGLYNLRLPLNLFGRKGIYTVYIRPREYTVPITDIGCLAAYSDIRGVVFKKPQMGDGLPNGSEATNALVGYRIEFLDPDGKKTGDFKIITSSNICEPLTYPLTNTSEKGVKYRFTMSGGLIFCTVTPSLASTFKPNDKPFIGNVGESVKVVNTKFNPILLEIEMVEHDDETISYMLEGNQLIDKDNAIVTTFNSNGEIYHQSDYGVFKDEYGTPLYEFKKERTDIDFNQRLANLE